MYYSTQPSPMGGNWSQQTIYLSIYLSIYLPIYLSIICRNKRCTIAPSPRPWEVIGPNKLSIYLSTYLYICLSIYLLYVGTRDVL